MRGKKEKKDGKVDERTQAKINEGEEPEVGGKCSPTGGCDQIWGGGGPKKIKRRGIW